NDGLDSDNDGICDVGDTCNDADGDHVGTGINGNSGCQTLANDTSDSNRFVCCNTDGDTCDDCASGTFSPSQDGPGGAECAGAVDTDGDGVSDPVDIAPTNPFLCEDVDADSCDDCSVTGGPPDTHNDGRDTNGDGICDRFNWYDVHWGHRKSITVHG